MFTFLMLINNQGHSIVSLLIT